MTEKIIEVIKKITSHPDEITNIYHGDDEYYFQFNAAYMSILNRSGSRASVINKFGAYSLYVYPRYSGSTENLKKIFEYGNDQKVELVSFHSSEFENNTDLFKALYSMVEEKYSGVNEILDSILKL